MTSGNWMYLLVALALVAHVYGDFCDEYIVGLFVFGACCLCGLFLFSQGHTSHLCMGLIHVSQLLAFCWAIVLMCQVLFILLYFHCSHIANGWYCFVVPSYSVLLTSIIHSPYNLYNLTMLFVLCIIHMLDCCMSNLLSSLADSLVSLTPDSSVLLLLPHPYLLVCACNCTYIRT